MSEEELRAIQQRQVIQQRQIESLAGEILKLRDRLDVMERALRDSVDRFPDALTHARLMMRREV